MPNKMERFTQRARRALSLAQEEAEHLGHHQIGTDHLLLSLMREEGGFAGRVLRDMGLDSRRVEELVKRLWKADERSTSSHLDLSLGTKKALELAVDEARRMGHNYIGSEHLLLGLLRQQEGIALDILLQLGLDRETIRREVVAVLREHTEAAAATFKTPQPPRPPLTDIVEYLLIRMSSRSSGISHFPVELSLGTKEALENALKEVGHTGLLVLDERHLLLGLLHDSMSAVSRALLDMGIDRQDLILKLRNATDK